MDKVKIYIKSKFGNYAELAKVLNLTQGTVKNAISKNDDVSWLNLLKFLSNEKRYKITSSRKLANTKAAKFLFTDVNVLTRFCQYHKFSSFSGSALDNHQLDKNGRKRDEFYFTIAKYNAFADNKRLLIEMLDDFFSNDV